jgi:hypothetical protein
MKERIFSMKKYLKSLLLLLLGVTMFIDIFVAIYVFTLGTLMLVAAKFSYLVGLYIIGLASIKIFKIYVGSKMSEEG